ncbi:MAG: hypothetical protein K2I69_07835 [Muribaculaceae bacterium]|nr:hypothetical protein [Muribaculaceae bacterium]
MADNYLEKKMEEHRAGVRQLTRRLPAPCLKTGFVPMQVNVLKAFVDCGDGAHRVPFAIVKALSNAGIKVLLSCTDTKKGKTASAMGARYYPCDAAKALQIIADTEKIDLYASFDGNTLNLKFANGENRIICDDFNDENMQTLGETVLLLCLSSASMLRGMNFYISQGSAEISR